MATTPSPGNITELPTQPYDLPVVSNELTEIIRDVPVIIKETKSGYKTTEFWTSIVAVLVPLLAGAPEKLMIPLVGAIGIAYTISRGIAKHGTPAAITPAVAPEPLPVAPGNSIVD